LNLNWQFRVLNLGKTIHLAIQTVDEFITTGVRTGGDCCCCMYSTVAGLQKLEYPIEKELGIPEECCCWVYRTIEEVGTLQYPAVEELGTV